MVEEPAHIIYCSYVEKRIEFKSEVYDIGSARKPVPLVEKIINNLVIVLVVQLCQIIELPYYLGSFVKFEATFEITIGSLVESLDVQTFFWFLKRTATNVESLDVEP